MGPGGAPHGFFCILVVGRREVEPKSAPPAAKQARSWGRSVRSTDRVRGVKTYSEPGRRKSHEDTNREKSKSSGRCHDPVIPKKGGARGPAKANKGERVRGRRNTRNLNQRTDLKAKKEEPGKSGQIRKLHALWIPAPCRRKIPGCGREVKEKKKKRIPKRPRKRDSASKAKKKENKDNIITKEKHWQKNASRV